MSSGVQLLQLSYLMEGKKKLFYLTTHSTHFSYGYMASDIWLRTFLIVRKETHCCHIGYSFQLTARVLLYAPTHRQDNTYHSLCYTSHGALAGTRTYLMASWKTSASVAQWYEGPQLMHDWPRPIPHHWAPPFFSHTHFQYMVKL